MTYSIRQISNVVRTYNQQLRAKPPPLPQSQPLGQLPGGEEQVSISSEGRGLLKTVADRNGIVNTFFK